MHDFYKKHVILKKKLQEIKLYHIVVLVLDMLCKKNIRVRGCLVTPR
jgi:hypothetical protein